MSRAETNWWRLSGVFSALAIVTPLIGIGVAFLSFRPGAIAVPRAAFVVGVWIALVSLAGLTLLPGAIAAWRERFSTSRRRWSSPASPPPSSLRFRCWRTGE